MSQHADPAFQKLADHLHRRELAVFCGAGISMDRPTSLPSWRELTNGMLDAIAEASQEAAGQSYARMLKEAWLPPEMIAQKLHDVFGNEFFDSLDVLKTGEPNLNHLYLAALAKTGRVPAIVTANFDTFIEKALRALEVPHKVYRRDEEFADWVKNPPPQGTVTLIKIHGCIDAKDTIIATLKDTGRGLATAKKTALAELLKRYVFLFLGYSGNDFNLDDNKIAMRDAQSVARGFFWNFRPGESNPVVESLVKDYGSERAHKIEHVLPDLLVDLTAQVSGSQLATTMKRWAAKLPPEHFRVMGELLHHAGKLEDAKMCYELQGKVRNNPNTQSIDPKRRAISLHNLGRLAADRGEFHEALDSYSRALVLHESQDDRAAQAETLHQIGHLYQARAEFPKALEYYNQALEILATGDGSGPRAAVLHQIGSIHHELGELDQALQCYGQAIKLQEAAGDHESMAATLHQTGLAYHAQEKHDEALAYFERAKKLEHELGIKRGLAPTLSAIGLVHLERQDYEKAREHFRQAKEIAEGLQDKAGMASCCHNLGIVSFETGDVDLAGWNFDAALKLREAAGDQLGMADTLDWLGEIARERGDNAAAKAHFTRGAEIFRACGIPERADALRAQAEAVGS
ncbi:MAG: tetratricopeptide repeat protein [Planctomycetota bacterium]